MNDGVRWFLDNPNIQVFISFTVKITAPCLKKIRYSPYQQKLWEIIKEKHDSGMGYRRISYWLNEHGYKTTRGHEFKNTHVFSIFKKKKLRDKTLNIKHKFEIKNTSLIVLEIPIMLEGENEHI